MEYTEKEKKAIEKVEILLNKKVDMKVYEKTDYRIVNKAYKLYKDEDIKILLNLIEKQQKEIEKKDKRLKRQFKLLQKRDKEIEKKEQYLIITREAYNKVLLENAKLEDETKNSIPKETIREKIKYLDENGYWEFLEKRDYEETMEILKELLGE